MNHTQDLIKLLVDLNMRGFLELLRFVGGSAVEKNILV